MNAGLFNMFLNAGDDARRFVGERIDVEFRCLLKKFVDQYRTIVREIYGCPHVFVQTTFVIDNRHRASAQDVAGTHQHGITNSLGNHASLCNRSRGAVFRLRDSQFIKQSAETLSIFGQVNRIR